MFLIAPMYICLAEFFFILPTILGSNDILCSNANMLVAINDSTIFCQIQGIVCTYNAINSKSSAKQKFHGLLDFVINLM